MTLWSRVDAVNTMQSVDDLPEQVKSRPGPPVDAVNTIDRVNGLVGAIEKDVRG